MPPWWWRVSAAAWIGGALLVGTRMRSRAGGVPGGAGVLATMHTLGVAGLMAAADVLITDLMMPGCDGLEVIANARAANPGLRIIAMSGGGRTVTTDFLPMAQELGADRILRKPFLPDDLAAAVAALGA